MTGSLKLMVSAVLFFCALNASVVYGACGEEAMRKDNWTEAFNDCKKAVDADANSVSNRLSLADYAGRLMMFDVAAEQYVKIIELERNNPAADFEARFASLASSLTNVGDYANAALMYRKADELSEDGGRFIAWAKVFENNVKIGFKRTPEAPLTEKIIKSDQKLFDQITPMSDAGKDAEALSAISELIKRRPNFSNAIFVRGLILQKLKRIEESTKDFERAVRLKPWDGLFNVYLAENYSELRNDEGCVDANTRIILNQAKLPFNREGFVADAYRRRAICRSHDNSKYIQTQSDFLQYSWAVNKDGLEGASFLAGFALDNGCEIKDFDDPVKNYNRGVEFYNQKKYVCAIYSLNQSILRSQPNSNGRTQALFVRAGSYDALSGESYEFSLQALKDYGRASALDSTKTAIASYRRGRVLFGIAEKFIKKNAERIGVYELAVPEFEKALGLSDAATQKDINYDLFNTRIRIVRGLITEIRTQKRKGVNDQVSTLTQKLNTAAAKIEGDYKVFSQDASVADQLLKSYTAFKVSIEEFKKAN